MSRPKTLIQPHFKIAPLRKFVINRGTSMKVGQTNSVSDHSEQYFNLIDAALSYSADQIKKNAIDDFVKSAKRKGYWDKIIGLYLPIWGNITANKYNLKNPLLKELSFSGSITHANGSIAGSGGAYIDSGINPSIDGLTNDSALLSFNCLTDSSEDVVDMGAYGSITQQMYIKAKDSSGNSESSIYLNTNKVSASTSSSSGFFTSNRNSSTSLSLHKDNLLIASTSSSGGTIINGNVYLLAANSGGSPSDASSRNYNFFCVGKGITLISDFNSDISSLLSNI
jgi:hypothetical protein|tara:strand:+ start:470 stop:1315 length:846 start_codon:yes stop_codon:yes gene_type:complete